MDFVRVGKTTDFAGKRFRRYTILARKVAVFREPDGSFYAIEFACKHQNWDLSTGRIDGDLVTCPRHGWVYNIRTGACLTHDSKRLRRYAVKVEGGDVYLSVRPVEDADDAPADEEEWPIFGDG